MCHVNYKLTQLFICAKVDNLGNVLHQLNIFLYSQITRRIQLI